MSRAWAWLLVGYVVCTPSLGWGKAPAAARDASREKQRAIWSLHLKAKSINPSFDKLSQFERLGRLFALHERLESHPLSARATVGHKTWFWTFMIVPIAGALVAGTSVMMPWVGLQIGGRATTFSVFTGMFAIGMLMMGSPLFFGIEVIRTYIEAQTLYLRATFPRRRPPWLQQIYDRQILYNGAGKLQRGTIHKAWNAFSPWHEHLFEDRRSEAYRMASFGFGLELTGAITAILGAGALVAGLTTLLIQPQILLIPGFRPGLQAFALTSSIGGFLLMSFGGVIAMVGAGTRGKAIHKHNERVLEEAYVRAGGVWKRPPPPPPGPGNPPPTSAPSPGATQLLSMQ